MIEHLRAERRIVERLYDGAAQLVETAGTRAGPGTVVVRVDGRPVAVGGSFQAALQRRQAMLFAVEGTKDVSGGMDAAERQPAALLRALGPSWKE